METADDEVPHRNSAATSEKGYGEAPASSISPPASSALKKQPRAKADEEEAGGGCCELRPGQSHPEVSAQPTATPTPSPEEIEANLYDELMTRNYICELTRRLRFRARSCSRWSSRPSRNYKGWKLIGIDQRTGVLNCVYTSQVLGVEDDVRIVVTPQSDVAICSQSKSGEPQSGSLLGFFPGDFGANMGHIKQFYAALKDKTDAVLHRAGRETETQGPQSLGRYRLSCCEKYKSIRSPHFWSAD